MFETLFPLEMTGRPSLRVESVPGLLGPARDCLSQERDLGISKMTPTLSSRPSPPAGLVPRLGVDALEGGGDDPGPYCIGFTGQSTSRVGAVLPGPYVQATGAPHVNVEHVEDVEVGVEVLRLLLTRFADAEVPLLLLTRLSLHREAVTKVATSRLPIIPRRS